MTPTNTQESKGIVSFVLSFPIFRRFKVVKELILTKFDLIVNQILSIKDLLLDRFNNLTSRIEMLDRKTGALLENDTPLLQAAIHFTQSLQSAQQENLQNFTTVKQSLLQLGEVVAEKVDTLQAENRQIYQSLSEAVDHFQIENQQRHQSLSEAVDHFQIENQQRHQSLSEAVDHFQIESQQRHQSLSEAVDHLQIESQQRHQSLVDSVQQAFSSIEVLSQDFARLINSQSHQKIIIDSGEKFDVEARLMAHLYSYLPSPIAIDIGANIGDISESLLKAGYEVYAFEPFPPTFSKLTNRLSRYSSFRASSFAIGSADGTGNLHIAVDTTDTKLYGDSSLYSSLLNHSMPEDLSFIDTVPVTVRTLESLHNSLEIPSNIGLVKIDTEGFDREVIRGMGPYRYPVVVTEFWDKNIPFGQSETFNKLEDIVQDMRQRKYLWYIVIYRVWDNDTISFYCNYPISVHKSWGNIFFFQDQNIFFQALNWCSAMLPMTYLKTS